MSGLNDSTMYGTYINTIAVVLGGLIGVALHKEFPERIKRIIFQGIGLMTLFIGLQMALKTGNMVVLFFSILVGAIIEEIVEVEELLDRFGDFLKNKSRSKDEKFIEGLITAFLILCVGSMTIVGAIEDGLNGDPSILIAKSILDGFVSVSLAAVFGIGVLFSAIPLFVFQGAVTLLTAFSRAFFTEVLVNELSAVGGTLLLGLGIKMLELKEIKVTNMLPSLVVVPVLVPLLP